MNFNEDIKDIRKHCVLSQEDFAKELGVSFATVNRWEMGHTKPSYKTLRQVEQFCRDRNIAFDAVFEIRESSKNRKAEEQNG